MATLEVSQAQAVKLVQADDVKAEVRAFAAMALAAIFLNQLRGKCRTDMVPVLDQLATAINNLVADLEPSDG